MKNKYSALKNRINGPVFSIITPFDNYLRVDFPALEKYMEHLYSHGARIFYVMAYNSRFSELTNDEIKSLSAFVCKTAKSIDPENIVIVADPIHCSTEVSLEFARHAEDIGADIISLIFREKLYSNDQVFEHYAYIAENTEIGLLIHEMPFLSGRGGHVVDWPVDLIQRVSKIPSVVAIKEDAKNDELSKQIIESVKDDVSIVISGGGKRQWLRNQPYGCQAWLNGVGVFAPYLATNFYKAFQAGNQAYINRVITEVEEVFFSELVSRYGWHLAAKAAIEAMGLFSRTERMPMKAISDTDQEFVNSVIRSLPLAELETL